MAFRKAIRGRITAGGKPGKSGLNASTGGKIRRHAGTIPTAYWRVNGVASDSTTLVDSSKAGHSLNGTLEGTIKESGADATWNTTGLLPGSHQSLYFNGSNNKVTVPYNALFKPDNAIKKLNEILPARVVIVPFTMPRAYIFKKSNNDKPFNPGSFVNFSKFINDLYNLRDLILLFTSI